MSCHNSFAIYAISRGFVHAIKSATEFLMYKHAGSIHGKPFALVKIVKCLENIECWYYMPLALLKQITRGIL